MGTAGKFIFMGGPDINYLVSDQAGDNLHSGTISYGSLLKLAGLKENKFDIDLTLGAEYYITKKFGLDLRYNLGLSKIDNGMYTIYKNRALQFSLLYKI